MKLLLTLLLAIAAQAAELRVGRAAVSITPPTGIPMAGYYTIRLAEGRTRSLRQGNVLDERIRRRWWPRPGGREEQAAAARAIESLTAGPAGRT